MASNPSSMHNDPCQYGMNMSYGSQMFSDVSGGPYRPTGLSSGPDQSMNPGMNNMGSQMGCGMGGGSMMNTSMTSPMNNSMQMNDFNMSNQFPGNYSQVPQSRMPQFQPPQRMNSCPSVSTSSQQQLHSPNASMMHPNQNTSMGPPSIVPMAPMMRQFSQPNLPMSHNAGNQMPRPRSSHTMPSHSPGGTRNPLPSPHMPVPSPLAHDMFASPNYPSPMQRSSQTPQNGMAHNNQQQQQHQQQQQQEMQQGLAQGMQQGMQQGMPGPNSQQQQQHQHQMMMQQANHPGAGSGMGAMNPNGMPQNTPSVSSQASCAMSSQNMSSCAMSSSGMTSGINTSQGMPSQGMNQGMLAPHSSATMMNHSMANSHMMHEFHGYTSFTSHELPPAFPNFKGLVAHVNPKNASMYYDRPRKQLTLPYPTGSQVPHPKEPPTFGFMQGNPYYDVRIASMPRPPPSFPTAAAQPAAPATGGNGRKGSYNAATGSGRPPAKKARTTANARTKAAQQQQAAAAAAAAQQEKMMSPMFPNPAMSGMGPMGMNGQMCQMSGGRMGMVPGMNGPMPGGPMSGGPMSGGPMSGSHMPGGPMSAGQMPAHMMHPEGPPQMMMGHPMGQQGMSGSPFGGLPGGSNMSLQKQQSKDNLFQPVPPAYEPLTPGTASSQGDHNSEDGSQQTNGQHMGNMNQPQNAQHQQQQLQKQGMDPMMSMNRMGNQLNHQQAPNQMGNQMQHPQGQHPGQQQPPQGLNKNGMGTDLPKIGDFSAANPFNGYNQGMRSFDLEPNNICAGCRQQIMANSPSVRCCGANDCGRIFHQQCCGLSPMAFEGLCNEKMIKWICRDCELKQPTGLVTVM